MALHTKSGAFMIEQAPRLAVIGCGSESTLVPALRRIGWRPSVLIDIYPASRNLVVRKIGRWRATIQESSNWTSVADKFDAALITPLSESPDTLSVDLAHAGKHVFVENPLGMTEHAFAATLAAADRNRTVVSIGFHRRHLQAARWLKALLDAKVLGPISKFEIREGLVFTSENSRGVRFQPNVAAGGILRDTGAHILDLMLWWLGGVKSVTYRDDNEGGMEADCLLECVLESGANGRIVLSRMRQLCNSIRIEGMRGFVECHLHRNEVLAGSPTVLEFTHDGANARQWKDQFVAQLVDAELQEFRKSISARVRVGDSGRDGMKVIQLIGRCYAGRTSLRQPWQGAVCAGDAQAGTERLGFPSGSKILVTGATGFIGGRLVERLIRQHGANLRCPVRNVGRAVRLLRFPVELVRSELDNASEIDRALDGVDYIFHCAYDDRSPDHNVAALQSLIAACRSRPIKRLVHLSTFAVYEPFPDGPLTEGSRDGDRSNVYVDTKLDLEAMIFDEVRRSTLAATIVQPTIVYGPFCAPWTNGPAEKLIFGDVVLPDLGEGLCNAIYVDDLVDGLLLAAVSPSTVGERFIISGPQPVTWATFFTAIAHALGTKPPIFWPHDQIAKANDGVGAGIGGLHLDPKRLVRVALNRRSIRRVLQAGLDVVPNSWRMRLMNYYLGPDRFKGRRQIFVPSPQALALYRSKAIATSEKARTRLGFRPRFDFERGMAATARYLEWAYGDVARTAS
jgi:nucleoside-diphosphate-sugar epimerase/predicted dehydrogenase